MTALDVLRSHHADPHKAALAWKAKGGKVVGYLCDNVPDELIAAAGFFPLRISGDPDADGQAVRQYVDTLYPPDVTTRPGFATAMLNRLLDGTYGYLDFLIVPHNRNAIQAIYRSLRDARKAHPELPACEMHYLDKAWSSSFISETYNRDQVVKLKAKLEVWAGAAITDDALHAAIAVGNENKALLAKIAALRAATPPRLSGVDALQIIGASMLMAKADHNALLRDFLASADSLPERAGPRVFLGGSPIDHTRICQAIEATGATVVAEDHCWGNRSFDLPVEGPASPILELASRFHRKPACSITFPLSETVAGCARRAAAAAADAAIFYVMDEDWSQNWETPNEVRAIEANGTPSLHLKQQAYDGGDPSALTAVVAEFLAAVQKRAPRRAPAEGATA